MSPSTQRERIITLAGALRHELAGSQARLEARLSAPGIPRRLGQGVGGVGTRRSVVAEARVTPDRISGSADSPRLSELDQQVFGLDASVYGPPRE
jgi:hypothetical protein